ncbi:MAG: amino acid synthesis family protein [Actinobacteria bacterium]|nr:amino acid synthesis family protein [Actinomycetota bacterium]
MQVRKFVVTCEDVLAEKGRATGRTVRRAVCSAVIANPLAGKPGADLTSLEALGAEISGELATRALAALGVAAHEVTAYGKGAIVGTNGEIEHAAALIHPRFGAPVRKVVIKGDDIIPSTKKIGAPGAHITLPITNKDDIWSFDEMDAIDVWIPDAPLPDEIVVSVALAVGGRPFARTKKPS